jgi:flagellar motor switch protein FliG
VALTGKQRAAMLLMSLDAVTAAELLRGVDAKVVKELAVELAYLDAAGYRDSKQSLEFARQFCNSLRAEKEFYLKDFLKEMLKSTEGHEKAEQIQDRIQDLLWKRDPFMIVHSADSQTIASVLEGQHPQAVAVVLSELPTKKSSEVLGLLGEGIRISAISRLNSCKRVTAEEKKRIAKTVSSRLEVITRGSQAQKNSLRDSLTDGAVEALSTQPNQSSLRKVAVILRNFGKEIRDGLLGAIQRKDCRTGEMVADLMLVWEDIPQIADGSLKKALRRIEPGKLALALVRADDAIVQKIKSNISDDMSAIPDGEVSMSVHKKKDIEQARDAIVRILREMNEKDELEFMEEQCNTE